MIIVEKANIILLLIISIYGTDNITENTAILNEEKINLYKKLQNLDEKTREVIYLRITGELSFKEIGMILNKTENWARVTFYRGKNKLKEVDYDENERM